MPITHRKKAVQLGMDPVTAVKLVTLNPAEYFGLKDRGAVAPGYSADLMVLDNLENFEVDSVYKDGHMVVGLRGAGKFPNETE